MLYVAFGEASVVPAQFSSKWFRTRSAPPKRFPGQPPLEPLCEFRYGVQGQPEDAVGQRREVGFGDLGRRGRRRVRKPRHSSTVFPLSGHDPVRSSRTAESADRAVPVDFRRFSAVTCATLAPLTERLTDLTSVSIGGRVAHWRTSVGRAEGRSNSRMGQIFVQQSVDHPRVAPRTARGRAATPCSRTTFCPSRHRP